MSLKPSVRQILFGKRRPWTPANIATELWLDAADNSTITQSSGLVSQWNDKSGNNRNATASLTARPAFSSSRINGLPAIFSDGIDDLMSFATAVIPNNFSIIAVGQANSVDGQKSFCVTQFIDSNNGRFQAWFPRSVNDVGFQLGIDYCLTSKTLVLNANELIGWQRFSVNGFVFANGTQLATSSIFSTITNTATSIFGRDVAFSQITIGELIVVSTQSVDTRQRTEGYLAHKWGLTANLPSNHPYKTNPPTV